MTDSGDGSKSGALSGQSPVATRALTSARDTLEANVRRIPTQMIFTFFDLNDALKQPERSVAFYLQLKSGSPWHEKALPRIFPLLVEARRYEEIVQVTDLETHVSGAFPKTSAGAASAQHTTHLRHTVEMCAGAIETLIAVGQWQKARRSAERAIEAAGIKACHGRFLHAAQRANTPDSAKFIGRLDEQQPGGKVLPR